MLLDFATADAPETDRPRCKIYTSAFSIITTRNLATVSENLFGQLLLPLHIYCTSFSSGACLGMDFRCCHCRFF